MHEPAGTEPVRPTRIPPGLGPLSAGESRNSSIPRENASIPWPIQPTRAYYFKVESGTIQRDNAGDANTPCRIADSRDIRVYCMYGNVRKLVDRPMLEVVNSRDVLVAQLKAFQPGNFPHIIETMGDERNTLPSSTTCALFVRDEEEEETDSR